MSKKLGIMQGRLTNKGGFFPQQFPWENWKDEFFLAAKCDIGYIEWMFNSENYSDNPIWTKHGRKEIKMAALLSGTKVSSICVNFFMQNSIYEKKNREIFRKLIEAGEELEIRNIVLPLFEASKTLSADLLCGILGEFEEALKGTELYIGLESDFPIIQQKKICESLQSGKIGICYDVGNAAGNGSDCISEVREIRSCLVEVHLKDKKCKGASVMLGEGDVDFRGVFQELSGWSKDYFILESYFGIDAKADTGKNIQYIQGVYNE